MQRWERKHRERAKTEHFEEAVFNAVSKFAGRGVAIAGDVVNELAMKVFG